VVAVDPGTAVCDDHSITQTSTMNVSQTTQCPPSQSAPAPVRVLRSSATSGSTATAAATAGIRNRRAHAAARRSSVARFGHRHVHATRPAPFAASRCNGHAR
jgi:hypothetical protein